MAVTDLSLPSTHGPDLSGSSLMIQEYKDWTSACLKKENRYSRDLTRSTIAQSLMTKKNQYNKL